MGSLGPGGWLRRIADRRRWAVAMRFEAADQIPDRLPRRGTALVETASLQKWLAFDCPCDRGHRIMVNLDKTRRPFWNVVRARPLTVRPSVDAMEDGIRCHFTVTDGKIKWHDAARPNLSS